MSTPDFAHDHDRRLWQPEAAPNWTHPAELVRVIDGDTAVLRIDLGRYPAKVWVEHPVRIAGLWCPELREPGGVAAMEELRLMLMEAREIVVQTRKPNPGDVYGRIVAYVWADGVIVAEAMIAAGHGTKEKP